MAAQILRLAPEERLLVTSHLSAKDLKNFFLVCRATNHPLLTRELYRTMLWRFNQDAAVDELDSSDVAQAIADPAHEVALTLLQNHNAASVVQRLILRYESCEACGNQVSCRGISGNLMASLTGLKQLTILKGASQFLTSGIPLPPNLSTLHLGARMDSIPVPSHPSLQPDTPAPQAVWISRIFAIMQHPTLKSLAVGAFVIMEPALPSVDPEGSVIGSSQLIANLSTLKLIGTKMEPETLVNLLRPVKSLTSFKLTRVFLNIPKRRTPTAWNVNRFYLQDIETALESVRATVDDISITYDSQVRCPDEAHRLNFVIFPKLRTLTIDPSMLIGRRICRHCAAFSTVAPHYRPSSDLASMLPSSLEQLTLMIDLEQTARIRRYREEMLAFHLWRRLSFPLLRRIEVYECRRTQGSPECGCAIQPMHRYLNRQPTVQSTNNTAISCPFQIGGLAHNGYPGMDATEMAWFNQTKIDFEEVGVTLEFMGDQVPSMY